MSQIILDILYQDEYLVAINKPHGLLVHRSSIAADASEFALQILRDQLNRHVYPIHRLDRKTAGVLLFALDETTHKLMQASFAERNIDKKYLAIVRGYTDDSGEIDYPLRKENGTLQEALTRYKTLDRAELPIPFGKHASVRYSLVEVAPETGRMHQIRKHFAHIFHPIIADRTHGCNKQNRFFTEQWEMNTMLLHAKSLVFQYPYSKQEITIEAPLFEEFVRMCKLMSWTTVV